MLSAEGERRCQYRNHYYLCGVHRTKMMLVASVALSLACTGLGVWLLSLDPDGTGDAISKSAAVAAVLVLISSLMLMTPSVMRAMRTVDTHEAEYVAAS